MERDAEHVLITRHLDMTLLDSDDADSPAAVLRPNPNLASLRVRCCPALV